MNSGDRRIRTTLSRSGYCHTLNDENSSSINDSHSVTVRQCHITNIKLFVSVVVHAVFTGLYSRGPRVMF